ncbi:MAG TPA: phosphatase PAP2 family protein, partial [Stellaceae bacterium]|nr:phosphatase PAP2 family protein [Stellaceae bacterium]
MPTDPAPSPSTPNSDPAEAARRLGLAALAGLLPAVLAILFVDRAVSDAVHEELHGVRLFVWLTWIAEPILPLSAAFLLLVGGVAAFGRLPAGGAMRVALAAAVASLVASAIKDQLKYAFGRTWPETWTQGNPSWIGDHVYGFFPFHGGQGWASFPSGHTTMIAAPMAVLWCVAPRLRPLLPVPVLLV